MLANSFVQLQAEENKQTNHEERYGGQASEEFHLVHSRFRTMPRSNPTSASVHQPPAKSLSLDQLLAEA